MGWFILNWSHSGFESMAISYGKINEHSRYIKYDDFPE